MCMYMGECMCVRERERERGREGYVRDMNLKLSLIHNFA